MSNDQGPRKTQLPNPKRSWVCRFPSDNAGLWRIWYAVAGRNGRTRTNMDWHGRGGGIGFAAFFAFLRIFWKYFFQYAEARKSAVAGWKGLNGQKWTDRRRRLSFGFVRFRSLDQIKVKRSKLRAPMRVPTGMCRLVPLSVGSTTRTRTIWDGARAQRACTRTRKEFPKCSGCVRV